MLWFDRKKAMSLGAVFGPPCIVVHLAVHSYQPCKKADNIYVMFQLDKLSVIVAEKQRRPIRHNNNNNNMSVVMNTKQIN